MQNKPNDMVLNLFHVYVFLHSRKQLVLYKLVSSHLCLCANNFSSVILL